MITKKLNTVHLPEPHKEVLASVDGSTWVKTKLTAVESHTLWPFICNGESYKYVREVT